MAYEIRYTDSVNKGSIVIEDNTLNQETSLSYPGKGYTGYGASVNENFLHLLENFANENAPERPVEGQLWYDISDGVNQLKLYDGTTWVAANGVKKATNEPDVANSTRGDLWVNTETQQLYLFTGAGWILVGPDFSDGLLTGGQTESIVGIDDATYSVFVIKVRNNNAIIISSQAFTPKTSIPGFPTIGAGINLSSSPLVGTENLKYFGVAEKADALVIGGQTIPASNFLRADSETSSNFKLNVRNDDGVSIGSSGQLSLQVENQSAVIQQNSSGASLDVRMLNGTTYSNVLRIDARGLIGINTAAPEEELDLKGTLKVNSRTGDPTTGQILIDTTFQANDLNTGTLVTKGGAAIGRNLFVGGDLSMGTGDGAGVITSGNIVPDGSGTRNIGSSTSKYEEIHATTFFGNIQGNVSGTVSGRAGSADRLATATTFQATGDVENVSFEFDGQTGGTNKTFNLSISNSFISNKDSLPFSSNEDEILINKLNTSGGYTSGVYKVKKSTFLNTIPLVPAGVIVPFGGIALPNGWLFCDGAVVNIADYSILFEAIGYSFKDRTLLANNGATTFGLPDFRGRFALGLDNMNDISANRVTSQAADQIGGNAGAEEITIRDTNLPEHEHDLEGPSGNQYYAIREAAGEPADDNAITLTVEPGLGGTQGLSSSGGVDGGGVTGTGDFRNLGTEENPEFVGAPLNIMNPYLAVNYIIYTGQ